MISRVLEIYLQFQKQSVNQNLSNFHETISYTFRVTLDRTKMIQLKFQVDQIKTLIKFTTLISIRIHQNLYNFSSNHGLMRPSAGQLSIEIELLNHGQMPLETKCFPAKICLLMYYFKSFLFFFLY